MTFSPNGLWFAVATLTLFATSAGEASGAGMGLKPLKIKYSDSFGGGKGADFSEYSGHQKLVGETSASDTQSSGLLRQSSFPVRLVIGDIDQTASGNVPMAALDPGKIQRRYKVDGCDLIVSTGVTAVTVFGLSEEGDYQITNDAVYAHSVFNLVPNQKIVASASTEVFVSISESTKAECIRRFAGRRVYLGDVGFKDVVMFAVNNKARYDASVIDQGAAKAVFLEWSDAAKKPRLESEAGYGVLIESGRQSISAETGEFFIGMRLPWRLALKVRP